MMLLLITIILLTKTLILCMISTMLLTIAIKLLPTMTINNYNVFGGQIMSKAITLMLPTITTT